LPFDVAGGNASLKGDRVSVRIAPSIPMAGSNIDELEVFDSDWGGADDVRVPMLGVGLIPYGSGQSLSIRDPVIRFDNVPDSEWSPVWVSTASSDPDEDPLDTPWPTVKSDRGVSATVFVMDTLRDWVSVIRLRSGGTNAVNLEGAEADVEDEDDGEAFNSSSTVSASNSPSSTRSSGIGVDISICGDVTDFICDVVRGDEDAAVGSGWMGSSFLRLDGVKSSMRSLSIDQSLASSSRPQICAIFSQPCTAGYKLTSWFHLHRFSGVSPSKR